MKFHVRKMSRRRSRPVRQPQTATTCCFCGFSEDDEVEYGKLCTHNGIVTHYYCLLLSSNMEQNGNDNEGILGFLPTDIQKELRRGKRLACTYCKRAGATLGCCNTRCKRVFHLPCGLRAGSLHQFFGEFRSYCITHRIKQEIDEHIKAEAAAAGTVTCYICYEEVNPQNTIRTLWAPCCRKNAWFHRKCVQRLALSAGYFFKCPLCNNKQEFQQAMLEHGIFIPNQDASWELVPNAYQELLHRHNRCDAVECICPKGRSHTGAHAKWELVLCRLCGSQGVHKACGHIKLTSSVWECAECVGMLRRTNEADSRTNQSKDEPNNAISEDESSSDSDISVGRNPSPLLVTERPESPPPITSPIRLRPGPRSYKIQQAVQNAKRKESEEKIYSSNTLVPLSSRSDTIESPLPNEKINSGEASQVKSFTAEKNLLLTESQSSIENNNTSIETKSTSIGTKSTMSQSELDNSFLKAALINSTEPKRREAEVIMIDSDDEVEIISVKPKQNVLTTNDGRQIPIHSLYQALAETQKAGVHVTTGNSTYPEVSPSSTCQSKSIPGTKDPIVSDRTSLSNTGSAASAITLASLLDSSHLPKPPVTSQNGIDICFGKPFENGKNPDLFLLTEIPKHNSVMNLKITNVTSVREEDFAATVQELNNVCTEGSRSDLPLNVDQQVPIVQPTAPMHGVPKPRSTVLRLNTSATTDINMKRKSEEYAEKSLCNLPDNGNVVENHKKARTSESKDSGPVSNSTNMPWSINSNDVNRSIPLLATSILTCSSNGNKLEESTATLKSKSDQLQAEINGRIRMMFHQDIQKKNHVYKYPPGTKIPGGVCQKTSNNMYHVNLPNNVSSHNGSQDFPTNFPKVRRTYSSMQAQKTNQLCRSLEQNSTNVHDSTASNQQLTVNQSQNLPEHSSKFYKPETLATKQVPKSSESVTVTSSSVYQSRENVNREIQRYENKQQNLQTILSTSDLIFYNGLPKNCTKTPTGSNGNQPSVNSVSKTNQSITQLANGIPIPSGCDGDAGSSPAVEAGSTHQATSRTSVHPPTSVTFTNADATSDAGQSTDVNSSISNCVPTDPYQTQPHFSPTTRRKYCDKHRLIPEKVPIRNLKFHVLDSNNIQIFVSDTFVLNINVDTGNLQNNRDAAGPRSPMREDKMLHILTQQSYSVSSKSGITENYDQMNIVPSYKEHGLPELGRCSQTDYTSKDVTTSVTRSLHNLMILESKFNNSDTSTTAANITDSKNKASCVVETKYNIVNKISDGYKNQALLADNRSYCHVQKTDSTKNESLICASFECNNRNSFCIHHKENLSKGKKVCTAFNNNGLHLKNLCERDDNIMSIDKRKGLSDKIKQTSVKIFKYKNCIRSASGIDFSDKTHDCSNDKDDKSRSIRLNRGSMCLVKSLDGLSKSNLSTDCHNNFKKIVDRSSEFSSSIEDLDANAGDSLKNEADLAAGNGVSKILTDLNAAKSNKCFDTRYSNESKDRVVNTNCNINNFNAVLSSKTIESDISLRKPINTAFQNKTSSPIAENKSVTYELALGIKVKIDLNKIQQLIDSKPQLFDNRRYTKIKRSYEKRESETLPILEGAQDSHNAASDSSLHYSETKTASENVQDMDNSPTRKRLKYNSAFFEDHPNS